MGSRIFNNIIFLHYLAPKTDKDVEEIICGYHRNGVTSRTTVSELLRAEHGIIMG